MKRKLKPLKNRRPDEAIKIGMLAKEVSNRTGYTVKDITEVWRVGIDVIIECLKSNKSIILPKIGMIYPTIKPSRVVTAMMGGIGNFEKMNMAARWIVKFRPGEYIKKELLKSPPTQEQVDNLYED